MEHRLKAYVVRVMYEIDVCDSGTFPIERCNSQIEYLSDGELQKLQNHEIKLNLFGERLERHPSESYYAENSTLENTSGYHLHFPVQRS